MPATALRRLSLAVPAALLLASCGDDAPAGPGPEPTISLDRTAVDLLVGETAQITASTAHAEDARVTWSSGDPSVVSVDQEGGLTGLQSGSTTIQAALTADPDVAASAMVSVADVHLDFSGVGGTLELGETTQLSASVSGAVDTSVDWQSSDAEVATVDGTGLVTAVGAGPATITARAGADPSASGSVDVVVNPGAQSMTLTANDGTPLDLSAVSGTFTVDGTLSLPAGFQGTFDVLIDDSVVASQEVVASAPPAAHSAAMPPSRADVSLQVATVPTLEEIEALPLTVDVSSILLRNGPRNLRFRLRGQGTETFLGDPQILTLDNQSGTYVRYGFSAMAEGADGNTWTGGTLSGRAYTLDFDDLQPVMLDLALCSSLDGSVGFLQQGTLSGGRLDFMPPIDVDAPAGLMGLEGSYRWCVDAHRQDGSVTWSHLLNGSAELYPQAQPREVRVDYRAPRFALPGAVLREWFGEGYEVDFADFGLVDGASSSATVFDDGVGLVDPFDGELRLGTVYGSYPLGPYHSGDLLGGNIPETDQPSYFLESRFGDRLANMATYQFPMSYRLGFDYTGPVGGFVDVPEGTTIREGDINPVGASLRVDYGDVRSGIDADMGVHWQVEVSRPGITDADRCAVGGLMADGTCGWVRGGFSLDPALTQEGRITGRAFGMDEVGNSSIIRDRRWFFDQTAPQVSDADIPAQLTSGAPFDASALAMDNYGLYSQLSAIRYGSGTGDAFWLGQPARTIDGYSDDDPIPQLRLSYGFGDFTSRVEVWEEERTPPTESFDALEAFLGAKDRSLNIGGTPFDISDRYTPLGGSGISFQQLVFAGTVLQFARICMLASSCPTVTTGRGEFGRRVSYHPVSPVLQVAVIATWLDFLGARTFYPIGLAAFLETQTFGSEAYDIFTYSIAAQTLAALGRTSYDIRLLFYLANGLAVMSAPAQLELDPN